MAFNNAFSIASLFCTLVALLFLPAEGFDNSRSDNLAVYYGQNSYGATHSSSVHAQKTLSDYCQDDTIDAIPLAFLTVFFSRGGLPEIDLASTCNNLNGNVFPGTNLARCPDLADDIKACQARGKIVTISLGGATGAAGFSSDAQAREFAETVWNLFLGGSSDTRPFGDAVLDGVDLDVESGGGDGMTTFAQKLRELYQGDKKYYLTAAPQCPFPDAYLGNVISAVGFDAVYVQYNNYCGVHNYEDPSAWNFGVWDHWAKTVSPNKHVKVYIGAPAAGSAAGSGYVPPETLGEIAQETRNKYSSFGGIMLWDASQAYGNERYDLAVKNALTNGVDPSTCPDETPTTTTKTSTTPTETSTPPPETTPTTPPTPTTTPAPTPAPTTTSTPELPSPSTDSPEPRPTDDTPPPSSTPSADSCDGIQPWSSTATYGSNNKVIYEGRIWNSLWWSYGDKPGGVVGVWTDHGACPAPPAKRNKRRSRLFKY